MVSLADLYKAEGKEEDELIKKIIEENSYPMPKRKMEKKYIGYKWYAVYDEDNGNLHI